MTAENQNKGPSQEGGGDRNLNIQGSMDESNIVVGDHNTIQHINVFSPIAVGSTASASSQLLSKQEYRWRQVLVNNVKHYWLEGVLKKSLHNQALIELGLEERSQAVASPLTGVGEFPDEPSRALPEGTQAISIFDELGAGRTLLILGEPGAGKTTTLLKLAQSLIERIGDDLSQPIPIILNLSSWAKKRQPIEKWLVQDLYETFQVSKSLGEIWITDEQLVLCLDGLDEVEAKHRNACVEALNQFIQAHGRTEMVVCSRIKDYEALAERVKLHSAIYVQPLTPQSVDQYLEKAGEQLTALKIVLNQNAEIKAFAASPLILSVMSLVYQGCSRDSFPQFSNAKTFRQQLFEAYVRRMFQRRGSAPHKYPKEQAKYWLVWIAKSMVTSSQTVFLIERMQPSWLPTKVKRFQYRLESALIIGTSMGLFSGISNELSAALFTDMGDGLSTGLLNGLLAGLVAGKLEDIRPIETLRWSKKEAKESLRDVPLFGILGGFIGGCICGMFDVPLFGILGGFIGGCTLGILLLLTDGVIGGLKDPGMDNRVKPNQGMKQSARNALIFGFGFGLGFGLLFGLLSGLNGALGGGLFFGLGFGLGCGGIACLRHFSLRIMLSRMGYIPWNYSQFLDYAAERLFLQKVGGGYIFIHRMLLEHFAQMELEQKYSK